MKLAEYCIYSIKHIDDLEDAFESHKGGEFKTNRNWATELKLLLQAKKADEKLPIVFADAKECTQLYYWATIDSIDISDDKKETTYSFSNMKEIPLEVYNTDLILKSTGSNMP